MRIYAGNEFTISRLCQNVSTSFNFSLSKKKSKKKIDLNNI